ncbi:cysteine-rich PDZ-binding protein-like isoform X2 [Stylophora pistillata]|uniref:cysteine-rich PDZ-binding protein-like isoform X2 n=1 Tax=Stylophora pistillata TaxID=50429 RepID=UPI000C046D33|nr:cysteine-rich PDZ-binding protein-like isoform X2 [Stylophora pistillata]
MVCDKCQKKLGKVICPDPWKSGARNTTEGGGRKVNENKLLTQKKNRFNPYTTFNKCRICKQTVHQAHSHYCQSGLQPISRDSGNNAEKNKCWWTNKES